MSHILLYLLVFKFFLIYKRGNRREVDRARAAARAERSHPKEGRAGSVIERNESYVNIVYFRDAAALKAKIERKRAMEAAGGASDDGKGKGKGKK